MIQRRRVVAVVATLLVLAAVVLLAGIPVRTRGLGPHPRVVEDYDRAVADVVSRRDREASAVAPESEARLLVHGHRTPVAILLLHGFSNSPRQFDSLGAMFFRDGANVYVPRHPHHAERNGDASALRKVTAGELSAAADSAMDIVGALGDTVVVVGLSLGGTMAAWIAQYRPDARRVIIIAPSIAIASIPSLLANPVTDLAVRLPSFTHHDPADPNAPDRELGWDTRAIGEVLCLGLAVQRASVDTASAVRDISVVLNANDHTVAAAPVEAIAQRWRQHGASVQSYLLPRTLGLPHDVVDPRQPIRRTDIVYPAIFALAHGMQPHF